MGCRHLSGRLLEPVEGVSKRFLLNFIRVAGISNLCAPRILKYASWFETDRIFVLSVLVVVDQHLSLASRFFSSLRIECVKPANHVMSPL